MEKCPVPINLLNCLTTLPLHNYFLLTTISENASDKKVRFVRINHYEVKFLRIHTFYIKSVTLPSWTLANKIKSFFFSHTTLLIEAFVVKSSAPKRVFLDSMNQLTYYQREILYDGQTWLSDCRVEINTEKRTGGLKNGATADFRWRVWGWKITDLFWSCRSQTKQHKTEHSHRWHRANVYRNGFQGMVDAFLQSGEFWKQKIPKKSALVARQILSTLLWTLF